jgi:UDP-N-acetylmuramoylalanine--D-glutamate ligase
MAAPLTDYTGTSALVVGMARSGVAVARFLARRGARVVCNDRRPEADLAAARAELAPFTVEWRAGGHPDDAFVAAELVVVSPGVPADLPALARARAAGATVMGEIEFAFRNLRAPLVAITGTNGKSTTTTWTGDMLRRSGKDVFAGGNLGRPLTEAADRDPPPDVAVAEISSFQMEWVSRFRPQIAALTNLTPDHLDRHGSFEAYRAAKMRVFARQRGGDAAISPFGFEAELGERDMDHFRFRIGEIVRPGASADPARGEILLVGMPRTEAERYDARTIRLPGAHNLENALVALLCARLAGATQDGAARSLADFGGLEHRLELCAEIAGVRWFNDSKATNVDSTLIALRSFDAPIVWIAGGRGKGAPYTPLVPLLSGGRGRAALLIGEDAPAIAEAMQDALPLETPGTLAAAVARAKQIARPGDVVLLSPACASYDQFTNFEERGRRFRELVLALREGA